MPLPLTDLETLCEERWQDLPAETVQRARACKALVRAKKVKTPAQLWRVVFVYGGWDTPWRAVAGPLTALEESMTAQAVAARLRAWGPWGQALRRRRLPLSSVGTRPAGLRFVVIDASSLPAPGAPGTDHRLHSALDVVSWPFLEVLVRDVHPGETLTHCPLAPGDVAVADRGEAQCPGMRAAGAQGADLLVRLPPFRVVLSDAAGAPWERCRTWKRPHTETLRPLAVTRCAAGGQHEGRGWVPASRLNAEQAKRARHTWRQGHKKGTPSAASRVLAGGVWVLTTLAPAGLTAQTILALSRCRWHVAIAIKRWQSVRDVDA